MKTLTIFKESLINEGRVLCNKIRLVMDPFWSTEEHTGGTINSLRYRFSQEQLEPNVLYAEYLQWFEKVVECDVKSEINGVVFPNSTRNYVEIHELEGMRKNIEKIVSQLEAAGEQFFIRCKGIAVEIYDREERKVCIFTGKKMLKLFQALKSFSLSVHTGQLNPLLGYSDNQKGEITKLRNRINKKFHEHVGRPIDIIESGKTGAGYRVNDQFTFV